MTPQEFKSLLGSLDRISRAIENKSGKPAVEIVNRFSKVYTMLDALYNVMLEKEMLGVAGIILDIQKTYVKIANEVMNENNQNSQSIREKV